MPMNLPGNQLQSFVLVVVFVVVFGVLPFMYSLLSAVGYMLTGRGLNITWGRRCAKR